MMVRTTTNFTLLSVSMETELMAWILRGPRFRALLRLSPCILSCFLSEKGQPLFMQVRQTLDRKISNIEAQLKDALRSDCKGERVKIVTDSSMLSSGADQDREYCWIC